MTKRMNHEKRRRVRKGTEEIGLEMGLKFAVSQEEGL